MIEYLLFIISKFWFKKNPPTPIHIQSKLGSILSIPRVKRVLEKVRVNTCVDAWLQCGAHAIAITTDFSNKLILYCRSG